MPRRCSQFAARRLRASSFGVVCNYVSVSNPQQRYGDLRRAGLAALVGLLALSLAGGCGQTVEVGLDDALTVGGTASGNGGAGGLQLGGFAGSSSSGTSAQGGDAPCQTTLCRGKMSECGNCGDDDGDGLIDARDPDCLGPCDDDELGLSTGLATNQSAACRQDCYFDGDNGVGNDKCEWSHACDKLSVAPDYPPSGQARCKYGASMGVDCVGLAANQQPACLDTCLPLVPNGCDCFGCCELPGGSGDYRFIGGGRGAEGCQRETLNDPLLCPPCTPVPSCFNECEKCETCVGKVPDDATCDPASACATGERGCGPDSPCDYGEYCVTGCCVKAPEPS